MTGAAQTNRALVVGYGSIGQRHARLLGEMGLEVAVVSRRTVEHAPCYGNLESALSEWDPGYLVIASATAEHQGTLNGLAAAGYAGRVLIEKPLFEAAHVLPAAGFVAAGVAYNLRFHPVIQALRAALVGETALQVQAYAGQHLVDWRPGRDYRDSYSASAAAGGGVLRDLSHELDLLAWLFGPWRRLAALGGRHGALEIDSDDSWAILMELSNCPLASLQINYHDRPGHREIRVNTHEHTFCANLSAATLTRDGEVETFDAPRDASYRAQHQALLSDSDNICGLAQGLAVVEMVEAIETAARDGRWIERGDG